MVLLKTLVSLLSVVSSVSAAASPACTKFPYDVLLPLSNYPPAKSFCSTKFPFRPCTSTVTTTATRTAPAVVVSSVVATTTVTTGTSTATVTVSISTITDITATITQTAVTGTQTDTVTTTTATTTVYTSTATVTITTNAAPVKKARQTVGSPKVVYVPARKKAEKVSTTLQRRAVTSTPRPSATPASDPREILFKKLQSEASAFASTLCSCIGTQPPCVTSTATAAVTVNGGTSVVPLTATSSVQATTTTSVTATTRVQTNTVITTKIGATTTASVATTTTVSTATTTTTYVIIPTPVCNPGIQRAGGTFNCEYNVVCGQSIVNASPQEIPVPVANVASNAQCLLNCSNDPICNAFNYDGISKVCTLYETPVAVGGSFTYVVNPYADYGTFTGNC